MKKLLLSLFALLLMSATANAQAFDGEGDWKLLGGYLNVDGKSGFELGSDYGFNDYFSMGGKFRFIAQKRKDDVANDDIDETASGFRRYDLDLHVLGHLSEVLDLPSQVDLYVGPAVGIRNFQVLGGARFMLGETVGLYAEAHQNLFPTIWGKSEPEYFQHKFGFSAGIVITFGN